MPKINNILPSFRRIKYLREDGTPQTLIRTGSSSFSGISTLDRSQSALRTYWKYYSGDGTIFASINITAWNTIMVGYYLSSDDNDTKQFIDKYLSKLSLSRVLRQAVLHTLIFGDSYIEKIYNKKGDLSRLKVVDPRTMIINYNKYGDVESYQQEINGRTLNKVIKPEDIIHIRFFEIPGSPYGLSLIAPNKDTIDRKVKTDEALFKAIQRHGTKKWVCKVGSEKDGQIPPDSVMEDINKKLEDINSINEFVVPWFIDLKTIDEKGIEGVEEYFNYFQTQLVVGLLCPEEALGMGKGSTEATARIKAIMYERMIKAFQYEISDIITTELINPILKKYGFEEGCVTLKFNDVTEEDQALKAKWIGNLLRGFKNTKMPFTRNEIRSMFGFPHREDMDDIPISENIEDSEYEQDSTLS